MVRTKLISAAGTHPGLVRKNNEDRVHCDSERGVYMVIDGMGGQAAGEEAARLAEHRIRRRLERRTGTPEERIREAITVANNEIFETAQQRPEWRGMACVLTVALVEDGQATVGHVGDSRLYVIQNGAIRKITRDHSPVGEREDSGELGETEAMKHPRRNEVYRDVGSEQHSPDDPDFIEVWRVPVEQGTVLLLCSDGLSDQVKASEMLAIVKRHAGRPDQAIEKLIEAANLAGGKDNVSIVLAEEESFAPPTPEEPKRRGRILFGRFACLLYGALLASAGFVVWMRRQPANPASPNPPQGPRVLSVAPGASIAEAIGRALAGDVIEVQAGEYREPLRLREGVTLRSKQPREAILRASGASGAPAMAIYAEGLTSGRVVGFRILADAQMPLSAGVVLADSSVEIEDTEISGAGVGVEIRGASNPAVRACYIHNNSGPGIAISGKGSAWISHNVLEANGRGVTALSGAAPTLLRNQFLRNALDAFVLPPETPAATVLKFNYFGKEPAREPARGGKR
jgi:serine/threonine protein phosphatase PrpC